MSTIFDWKIVLTQPGVSTSVSIKIRYIPPAPIPFPSRWRLAPFPRIRRFVSVTWHILERSVRYVTPVTRKPKAAKRHMQLALPRRRWGSTYKLERPRCSYSLLMRRPTSSPSFPHGPRRPSHPRKTLAVTYRRARNPRGNSPRVISHVRGEIVRRGTALVASVCGRVTGDASRGRRRRLHFEEALVALKHAWLRRGPSLSH